MVTPLLDVGDGLLDVGEVVGRDQLADGQPAVGDHRGEHRDEGLGLAVAEGDAGDGLAAEHPVDVEADLGAERRSAHDDRGAAGGEAVDGLAQHLHVAGGLDDSVAAGAAGDLGDPRGEVLGRGVDDVGGAELAGQVEPVGHDVDRDDLEGRGEGGGHHGGEADRAGAGHDDGAAGAGLEHVPHGADAGLHAAAERGDRLQRRGRGRP